MSPELLLLAVLFSLTILALGWEAWHRRRGRRAHTCPHCGNRLKSVEPGRRRCDTCNLYFRRIE
ncbi:MAG: hypothetical protein HYV92_13650 [Candidatus Rokubacteria bacterium]|nr:hypothetical protein [Candidatus Rokubacteria bacterium]MBI2555430.1 hypothetical protein [Candidatus Rokubacteria bacterium]